MKRLKQLKSSAIRCLFVLPMYLADARWRSSTPMKSCLAYMEQAVKINPEHPVLIDRYMLGKEAEVDAICDGETVLIPGIMEHVERAGVHSGDSIAVYPPQSLSDEIKAANYRYYDQNRQRA